MTTTSTRVQPTLLRLTMDTQADRHVPRLGEVKPTLSELGGIFTGLDDLIDLTHPEQGRRTTGLITPQVLTVSYASPLEIALFLGTGAGTVAASTLITKTVGGALIELVSKVVKLRRDMAIASAQTAAAYVLREYVTGEALPSDPKQIKREAADIMIERVKGRRNVEQQRRERADLALSLLKDVKIEDD